MRETYDTDLQLSTLSATGSRAAACILIQDRFHRHTIQIVKSGHVPVTMRGAVSERGPSFHPAKAPAAIADFSGSDNAGFHFLIVIGIMRFFSIARYLTLSLSLMPATALAQGTESERCHEAASQAERAYRIPDGFLYAISRVESGKTEADGRLAAWPWTIMANGTGHYYTSKAEAVTAAAEFRSQGLTSIDVGCMQVNLQQHPDAFPSLEQAFDPVTNALYAGRFLVQMHDKMGSWPRAAAAYHSQTPGIGTPYQWKVLETWAIPEDERMRAPAAIKHAIPSPGHAPTEKVEQSIMMAEGSTSGAPMVKNFHPFTGFSHFTQPLVHRSGMSGMKGRGLASYRSMPTTLARPTG